MVVARCKPPLSSVLDETCPSAAGRSPRHSARVSSSISCPSDRVVEQYCLRRGHYAIYDVTDKARAILDQVRRDNAEDKAPDTAVQLATKVCGSVHRRTEEHVRLVRRLQAENYLASHIVDTETPYPTVRLTLGERAARLTDATVAANDRIYMSQPASIERNNETTLPLEDFRYGPRPQHLPLQYFE